MGENNGIFSFKPFLGSMLWAHILSTQTPECVLSCVKAPASNPRLYNALVRVATLPDAYEAAWLLRTGGKFPDTPLEEDNLCLRLCYLYWTAIEFKENDDDENCLRRMFDSAVDGNFRAVEWLTAHCSIIPGERERVVLSTLYHRDRAEADLAGLAKLGSKAALSVLAPMASLRCITDERVFWTIVRRIVDPGSVARVKGKCSPFSYYQIGQLMLEMSAIVDFISVTARHVNIAFETVRETGKIENDPVAFHLSALGEIRSALDTASIALWRCGVVSDVRLMIVQMLWNDKRVWIK